MYLLESYRTAPTQLNRALRQLSSIVHRANSLIPHSLVHCAHSLVHCTDPLVTGKVSGLMCSYNAINDIPACANPEMSTLVRAAWQFQGYITSDCGAVAGVTKAYPSTHYWGTRMDSGHGYKIPKNQSLAAAGLDSNCDLGGGTIGGTAAEQDTALSHLFAVQLW